MNYDPRGMMGIRLWNAWPSLYRPRTIWYNLRKTVERAGLQVENIVISPLAMTKTVLNEGERELSNGDRWVVAKQRWHLIAK